VQGENFFFLNKFRKILLNYLGNDEAKVEELAKYFKEIFFSLFNLSYFSENYGKILFHSYLK
jgi:hypothetical protein